MYFSCGKYFNVVGSKPCFFNFWCHVFWRICFQKIFLFPWLSFFPIFPHHFKDNSVIFIPQTWLPLYLFRWKGKRNNKMNLLKSYINYFNVVEFYRCWCSIFFVLFENWIKVICVRNIVAQCLLAYFMAVATNKKMKFEWRKHLLTFLRRQTWEGEKVYIRFLFHLFEKKLRDETVNFLFVNSSWCE